MAWDCGAGCSFVFLLGRHLALNLFPFPPSTAQRIGEFYNMPCRESSVPYVAPIYWRHDWCGASKPCAKNLKKSAKTNLSSGRITYWRRVQGSADVYTNRSASLIVICRTRLFFELYSAETEKDSIEDGGPMKRQKSIQHRSPNPLSIIWAYSWPPKFLAWHSI